MRVLVTGAYGFVGNAVVRRLADAGHEVHALTRRPADIQVRPSPALRVWRADVRDSEALRPVLKDVEGVCHLAALTQVRRSFEHREEYRSVNAGGTASLLEVLAERRAGPPPVFVLGSTAAVYGAPAIQPITEDTSPSPTSPYGSSKAEAELAVEAGTIAGHIAGVTLRCFNISGAVAGIGDGDETRIIPKAMSVAAGRSECLEMNGDGTAVRDFVHVDDVATAYVLALEASRSGRYLCYNVGATGASMSEIVTMCREVTGRPVPTVRRPQQPEAPVSIADTSRIRQELGWEPKRSSLREMLEDAWNAARG